MNALLLLIAVIAVLVVAYVFYGGWLAKKWGIDPDHATPAHVLEDGRDYEPAPPYVVLGHHFSSIAGAGPINGPIQAAIFGWVPVVLWVLIGGIFFGAAHDFGALFSSIRNKSRTLSFVVLENIDSTAKALFTVFAYLALVLLVAAFTSIVAATFGVTGLDAAVDDRNRATASISVFFVIAALLWGFMLRGRSVPMKADVVLAIIVIIICVAAGMLFHPISLDARTWMLVLGVYILAASLAPMWVLLQPRDYLSSYLLYGMMALAIFGIVGAGINGAAAHLEIPAFTGFSASNVAVDPSGNFLLAENGAPVVNASAASGYLFPALFITIACGAISGFHGLVASGTTSKQLDNERHAQPIAYGGMLIECVLAIISLCAVGFVWTQYQAGEFSAPTQVFASGLSGMLATVLGETAQPVAYQLLILAVSAFCLTTLDTATRLARYMLQEFWVPKGESIESVTGWRAIMTNKYLATVSTVALGVGLGMSGYTIIWPLFGAANQLLAALAMLAVSVWLRNAGRSNRMFYVPMAFMMCVTVTSLAFTIHQKVSLFVSGAGALASQTGGAVGVGIQLSIACLLLILALVLTVKGAVSLRKAIKGRTL